MRRPGRLDGSASSVIARDTPQVVWEGRQQGQRGSPASASNSGTSLRRRDACHMPRQAWKSHEAVTRHRGGPVTPWLSLPRGMLFPSNNPPAHEGSPTKRRRPFSFRGPEEIASTQRPMSTTQTATFVAVVLLGLSLVLGLWPTTDGAASDDQSLGSGNRLPSLQATTADTDSNKIGRSLWQWRYAEVEPGP